LEELVEERTKELKQAERLATIGKTAEMVAHDLRNPLQGMTSTLYLAKEALGSRGAAGRRELSRRLDALDGQIAYMGGIVADLQDYARPLTPELVATSLPDLIRDSLSTIQVPGNVKASVQVE
jgi:two-component system sensor histidine kinase PilS (NtrC family)